MKVKSILQIAQCLMNQDITIDRSFDSPDSGYMVSEAGGLELTDPDLDKIVTFVRDNFHKLEASPRVYFGSWTDNGVKYIDVSHNMQDMFAALAFGQINKQIAIWDVKKQKAINV